MGCEVERGQVFFMASTYQDVDFKEHACSSVVFRMQVRYDCKEEHPHAFKVITPCFTYNPFYSGDLNTLQTDPWVSCDNNYQIVISLISVDG